MISLIRFKEFDSDNSDLESMRNYFQEEPYQGQAQIIAYLDSGRKTYAKAARAYDFFTNAPISREYCGMTDGEFSWNSLLSYYVENYNMKLPEAFEEKVLSQSND